MISAIAMKQISFRSPVKNANLDKRSTVARTIRVFMRNHHHDATGEQDDTHTLICNTYPEVLELTGFQIVVQLLNRFNCFIFELCDGKLEIKTSDQSAKFLSFRIREIAKITSVK